MVENASVQKGQSGRTFNLSEVINTKVVLNGRRIGKLNDLIISENGKFPKVTTVVVKRPFGDPILMVPWDKVSKFDLDEVVIDIDDVKKYQHEPGDEMALLRDHILDKKILDLEDTEVEIVYDLKLILRNNCLYVCAVDSSRYGRLRRMGFRRTADTRQAAEHEQKDMIPWTYVQPLSPTMSRFKGEVKLRILKDKLSEMQPADVADILEELSQEQRIMVFDQLDSAQASDTLEEIDPNVQRELVASLNKDRVAMLIDQMTPGQAADLLSVLPNEEKETLIPKINKDLATKVRSIMEKQEEQAVHYATSKFIKIPPDRTTDEVQRDYPKLAKGKDIVMYLYVVDEEDKLLGVMDIKELLSAADDARLRDVMVTNVFSLHPGSTLREASVLFDRYDFRALPMVDDEGRMVGVVPYRDVMKLTHHFVE